MKTGSLDFARRLQQIGQDVSRETLAVLEAYAALLEKWQTAINLVSKQSLPELWTRHILDSAQLLPLLPPGAITDLGSGAGFPGLVLGIMTERPVHLVESDGRKAAFLVEAARKANVAGRVKTHLGRAENLPAWQTPIVTARALAPLVDLLPYAVRFLAPGGTCLFLKGETADRELTAAAADWTMKIERHASITNSGGVILVLSEIERRR